MGGQGLGRLLKGPASATTGVIATFLYLTCSDLLYGLAQF